MAAPRNNERFNGPGPPEERSWVLHVEDGGTGVDGDDGTGLVVISWTALGIQWRSLERKMKQDETRILMMCELLGAVGMPSVCGVVARRFWFLSGKRAPGYPRETLFQDGSCCCILVISCDFV